MVELIRPITRHFGFLDGLRGTSALIIITTHYEGLLKTTDGIFSIIAGFSGTIAMQLFFLLSAFLLTYRLQCELEKCTHIYSRKTGLYLGKYFIRRFFRIYVVYFIYVTLSYSVPPKIFGVEVKLSTTGFTRSWFQMITLHSNCSFLWSIPVEVIYYFILPVIALLFRLVDSLDSYKLIGCNNIFYFI